MNPLIFGHSVVLWQNYFLVGHFIPDHLNMIKYVIFHTTQGLPSQTILQQGQKTSRFFYFHNYQWKFKSSEQYERETGIKSKEARKFIFKNIDDIQHIHLKQDFSSSSNQFQSDKIDRLFFVDLLKKMIHLDQNKRITPNQALTHPFITMDHLVDYTNCPKYYSHSLLLQFFFFFFFVSVLDKVFK